MREIATTRVLCALADLEATGGRGFSVGEGDWPLRGFVVKTANGVAAYVNTCPHAGHPLDLRPNRFLTPDRNLILCASHGAVFTRDTGLCIAGPCPRLWRTPIPVESWSEYVLLAEGVDAERFANEPLSEFFTGTMPDRGPRPGNRQALRLATEDLLEQVESFELARALAAVVVFAVTQRTA